MPLSVVIGTGEGWPYVRDLLATIRADAESAGAEIVVADGSDKPPPPAGELSPNVRWVLAPDASIFVLFAIGLREATGDVVAMTEDHTIPRPGWIPAIIRAHAEHPEAAAIGGAIENGSQHGLIEWASYFTTQGPHMLPLGDREVPTTTNEANVSYKRQTLSDLDPGRRRGLHGDPLQPPACRERQDSARR